MEGLFHHNGGRRQGLSDLVFFARDRTLFFMQKCDEESLGQKARQTLLQVYLLYFFSSCQTHYQLLCYCCVVMWHCFVEHFSLFCWVKDLLAASLSIPTGTVHQCCASDTTSRGAAKFHPSPHLKLSHRGGWGGLPQDPRTQRVVWMGLLTKFHSFMMASCNAAQWKIVAVVTWSIS